jgi:multiple sugar transport system permease protein
MSVHAERRTERLGTRSWTDRLPFSPWHLILVPLTVIMLFPLLWMVITSIELPSEARHFPPILIPQGIHWQNYPNALKAAPFVQFLLNSAIVSITVVVSNLVFCSLAGYAFARIRFFGREAIFIALIATLMIPFQVTMIPTFLIVKWLGLHVSPLIGIDSLGALMVPNLASVFGIFMLRQFFRTLPIELEEAARIDGASRLGVLFKILLPLSTPALATLAAITFLESWNDFLWPLIVIQSEQHRTIQLGLETFQGTHETAWTLLMAGNVMSLVPMLVVFFAAQRYFIRSVATTGIKG